MSAYVLYSVFSRLVMAGIIRSACSFTKKSDSGRPFQPSKISYNFFKMHLWIDRFRSIVFQSPSIADYRGMPPVNIAFCYGYLGNAAESKAYFARTLEEFPNSIRAYEKNLKEAP